MKSDIEDAAVGVAKTIMSTMITSGQPKEETDGQIIESADCGKKHPVSEQEDREQQDAHVVHEKDCDTKLGLADLPAVKKKKKKKRSKSESSKGSNKPTGFEEFYAEAPLTPAQATENKTIYDLAKPVDERIQTAVQRFCARRKFDSSLKEVFDRYLVFGGIDSGPMMFRGGTDPDADELNAEEIAALKNTKFLNQAVLDGDMVVDFDGVLKAFLSSHSAIWFTQETQAEIKRRIGLIRNFFNFLLHHDVCPEYDRQIETAKRTCDVGEAQLWLVGMCGRMIPGNFNIACSVLFHGWYHDCYIPDKGGSQPANIEERIAMAQTAFRAALASHGSEEICTTYQSHNSLRKKQPLRRFRVALEVVRIEFASDAVRELYALPAFEKCKPTGKLLTRVWQNPAGLAKDLTEEEEVEEEEAAQFTQPHKQPEYEFWIEEEILFKIFTGLKFEADVYELTFGVFFFDSPANFRCSFFSWLPNEAMIGWRKHEYLQPRDSLAAVKETADE